MHTKLENVFYIYLSGV